MNLPHALPISCMNFIAIFQALFLVGMLSKPSGDMHLCTLCPFDISTSPPEHLGVAFRDRSGHWHEALFCLKEYMDGSKRKKAVLMGADKQPIHTTLPKWVTSITPSYHGNTDDCLYIDITEPDSPVWRKLKTLLQVNSLLCYFRIPPVASGCPVQDFLPLSTSCH